MEITLNNQTITVSDNETLESILKQNNLLDKKGIAVAVNSTVISKQKWDNYKLNNNDNIIIITATAGG